MLRCTEEDDFSRTVVRVRVASNTDVALDPTMACAENFSRFAAAIRDQWSFEQFVETSN